MDLSLNLDTGGDATDDVSSAPSEVESEGADTGAALDTTSTDSGADAPADVSLSTTDEKPEVIPTEEELLASANDPNTPQWAREKIKQAMGYAGSLKSKVTAAEERATQLAAQYEGKEILPQTDIDRYKEAEDLRFRLQSITAQPKDIVEILKTENARMFPKVQQHLVWDALENPDGTPDLDNLQFIVDRFAGEKGVVKAQDVLHAVQALKAGTITSEQFHEFGSVEEYDSFQRAQAREKELDARMQDVNKSVEYRERQIRETEVKKLVGSLQSQMDQGITPVMEQFKLMPVPGEPKVAADYKAKINARIAAVISSAPKQIRALGELAKAVELLSQPQGSDAEKAAAEIESFMQSPLFKQYAAKGISTLLSKIEKVAAEEAYHYKLMMLGLEQENSKAKTARPNVGSPNQGSNMPKLTAEDLAKLSAAERSDHAALALTEQLRQSRYGVSRMGQ